MRKLRTKCKRDHEFTLQNTIVNSRLDRPRPTRRCRICYNASIRACGKRWRDSHPEENLNRHRAYHKKNRLRLIAKSIEYRLNHLKQCKEAIINWKINNPEKVKAYMHKRRTAKTKAGGAYTSSQWIALCDKYGNKCLRCNKRKKLTPDHVIPVSKGGTSWIENIQPLCLPCNLHKGAKTTDYRWEINNGRQHTRKCRGRE